MGSERMRRVGVMGGSFDPVHLAHLIVAESVREALDLDSVLFVPVGEQPLKQGRPVTSTEHRVAMVELAVRGNPYFCVSRIEVDRAGPSFTVDTLRLLRQGLPDGDKTEMWFIVGADSLLTLPRWRDPEGIVREARLAVVRRPGATPDTTALEAQFPGIMRRIDWIDAPLMEISATDIRHRISLGRSIRYRVPDAVLEYIEGRGLYREA